MKNIKLTVEYDGTNYCGWQIQDTVKTIQGELTEAIYKLTGSRCEITGCSRTDKGVHAFSHISNFITDSPVPPDKFYLALNKYLPQDIIVKNSCEAEKDFNARFSCSGKKYIYRIHNNNVRSALLKDKTWYQKKELDVEEMSKAAAFFKGEFDFKTFSAVGGTASTTVREIFDSKVYWQESSYGGRDIFYEVIGSGFLYNMVRIITGTLADVGKKRFKPEDIKDMISSKDRSTAGITAPPQGLYLKEVYYGKI